MRAIFAAWRNFMWVDKAIDVNKTSHMDALSLANGYVYKSALYCNCCIMPQHAGLMMPIIFVRAIHWIRPLLCSTHV